MAKPRDRTGEFVCTCTSYAFPHRQFGGRCTLRGFAAEFFIPSRSECSDCMLREGPQCQVVDGVEDAPRCPALQEHIRYEEIRLYGRARESFIRAGVR